MRWRGWIRWAGCRVMRIEQRNVLVTGANRGLGKHFVESLITRGAHKVYACARAPETLAPLQARHGDRVVPLRLDITDPESVAAAATRADDTTLLVNNAGVLEHRGLMEAGSVAVLEREMAVNVYGLARMCLAFAPVIAKHGGGAIVNMLSVASLVSFPPFGSYSATKAAAMSLTHSLRYELKDKQVEQKDTPLPVHSSSCCNPSLRRSRPTAKMTVVPR